MHRVRKSNLPVYASYGSVVYSKSQETSGKQGTEVRVRRSECMTFQAMRERREIWNDTKSYRE